MHILHHVEDMWDICPPPPTHTHPPLCKKYQLCQCPMWVKCFRFRNLTPPDAWTLTIASQFPVSLCSQQTLFQNIQYWQAAEKCQIYPQKWLSRFSVFSQIIINFLKSLSDFMWWKYESITLFTFDSYLTFGLECSCLVFRGTGLIKVHPTGLRVGQQHGFCFKMLPGFNIQFLDLVLFIAESDRLGTTASVP